MDKNLAIETLKSFVKNTDNVITKDAILALHPELAESKDERVRNLIYCLIRDRRDNRILLEHNGVSVDDALAYLEKLKDTYSPNFPKSCSDCPTEIQSIIDKEFGIYGRDENDEPLNKCGDWKKGMVLNGPAIWGLVKLGINWQKEQQPLSTEETELNSIAFLEQMGYTCIPPEKEQKPAEWNDADDKIQRNLMSLLSCMRGDRIAEATYKKYYPWLRDLPKRFNLQQSPEWSEEDEIYLQDALWCVKLASKVARGENDMGACWSAERWLKSLHPQSHWKPSDK